MSAPAAARPPPETVRAWLVARLSTALGVAPDGLDAGEPLASYGLGSAEAVSLAGELEEWLGLALPPTLVYDHPTIDALAAHLGGRAEARSAPLARAAASEPSEAVAIVGIGCRFPRVAGPDAFWRLLCDGTDAVTRAPPGRRADAAYGDPSGAGAAGTEWGGFVEEVDRFDAHFFGIAPREAMRMDPQQRILLEVAWEALEDGGQLAGDLARGHTGVFVGIATSDYAHLQAGGPVAPDRYAGTGSALSIAANRISYALDLRGPSLAVDTACSSSLVALHLACRSLREGECTAALACGVNLILSPATTACFAGAGFLAPDGRCKAFDSRADGYVRGEGAGVVVLKPLSRALADGDPVYAVVLGSAVNQDGRSNGLTAPSRTAQEEVIAGACRAAGVSPRDVRYVEAHGTGTALGDPIEAAALGAVLASDGPREPAAIGSVKTNIGHLEAAAGIAGVIKVALSLHHHALPPTLHFRSPNPRIPFHSLPIRVVQRLEPWPGGDGVRVAGVSSFGFGGTNAHVVLAGVP